MDSVLKQGPIFKATLWKYPFGGADHKVLSHYGRGSPKSQLSNYNDTNPYVVCLAAIYFEVGTHYLI